MESRTARTSTPALVLVVVLGAVLATCGAAGVAAATPHNWWDATSSAVGLLYLLVGCVAWSRRPGNRTGVLICVTGILFLLATLINTVDPVLILLGVLGGQSVLAGLLHLLLAFPSGRLSGPLDRALVVAGYVTTVLPLLVQVGYGGGSTVLTALVGPPRPDLVAAADAAHRVLATAVLLLAVAVLVQRFRRSPASQRRPRAIVYAAGIAVLMFIPFSSLVLAPAVGLPDQARYLLQLAALAAVPFVVAVAILRGGFARTARIEELGMWLGADEQGRPGVRDALASALGDASLALYFPARSGDGLVDAAGRIVGAGGGGAASTVSVDGPDGTLAVIAYDAALIADADLVRQAGRVVALALERERLTAELLARRRELVESRSRLVEVADGERRRFAHDLHDLLQGRMVLAALHAGTLAASPDLDARTRANAEALRVELTEAISDVRRLVHGVMPALLVERGLFAAAEDLLDRLPIPVEACWSGPLDELPAPVSTSAYFILAEASANAVKHSGAAALRVRVERTATALEVDFADDGVGGARPAGAGLRGMRDRVDVLDGTFELASPAGGGTRLSVRLPCAS